MGTRRAEARGRTLRLGLLSQGEMWCHALDPAHLTQEVVVCPNIDMFTATHQHHLKL